MVVPTLLDGEVDAPVAGVPSAVAQLQHLELTMFYAPQGSAWEKNARMLAQVLQDRLTPHLASLTCLSVSAGGSSKELGSAFNQHISTMIKLKQLHLSGTAGETHQAAGKDMRDEAEPHGRSVARWVRFRNRQP
jgi:hypothetical protein